MAGVSARMNCSHVDTNLVVNNLVSANKVVHLATFLAGALLPSNCDLVHFVVLLFLFFGDGLELLGRGLHLGREPELLGDLDALEVLLTRPLHIHVLPHDGVADEQEPEQEHEASESIDDVANPLSQVQVEVDVAWREGKHQGQHPHTDELEDQDGHLGHSPVPVEGLTFKQDGTRQGR